ncbi:site-2 protease family protein [Roseovarius salinarum]|uniref:site-2 protease family protein n=1 Tax=Roseovarius salinarum TaxID=1981892 RepID=UPI000C3406DD|nr:site-2 protease family protein [Roseovarius salinarum]
MFTQRIPLFSILGFRVSLDFTWFLLAILIVWSLAKGYFPQVISGLDPATGWWLGIAGALGLFASIIIHEFSHAIVARQFDMPIRGITLFIFGGVAEMEEEPPSARAEFFMAIAGPIASYILAGLCWAVTQALPDASAAAPAGALFGYLALINLVLATFNLIPAFPLDGGRVLRSAVWWWTGEMDRATRYAAFSGRLFGSFLIVLGVMSVVAGNFIGGLWQGLIGMFIIGAAGSSESRMTLRSGLEGVRVRRLMVADPITVPSDMPVARVIEEYFYGRLHKVFPVVRDGRLLGSVSLQDVAHVAPEERHAVTAGHVVTGESLRRAVAPDTPVLDALEVMNQHGVSRLMVVDDGQLRGMLTMRDVMTYLSLRQELGNTRTRA